MRDAKEKFLKTHIDPQGAQALGKEIGLLGPVFDQDMANLPYIQQGLKSLKTPGIQLGRYQENRIRHYHQILDRWLDA